MLCLMTKTLTDIAGSAFPFADTEMLAITVKEEMLRQISEINNGRAMELPVNNYLKTHKEIELEFQYGIDPRKNGLLSSNTTTDGYLNIHDLDNALSGFMEENY
jgi:hypothetical protein